MRAVEDHHVDRPDVEARQRVKLTGTNPSIGLILPEIRHRTQNKTQDKNKPQTKHQHPTPAFLQRPGGHGEGPSTRSHPELGRETPQRRWYCVLRRGRVGRRQVFEGKPRTNRQNRTAIPQQTKNPNTTNAGWSSPVARQAHNLKVAGSNPAPATKYNAPSSNR